MGFCALKTVWSEKPRGSNFIHSANKKGTFVYQKFLFVMLGSIFLQANSLLQKRLMLSELLIQINIIEHYRQQAEREIYNVLCDRVASVKLGAAGIGAYTGVSVINIYHRFLDGHKLVVVSCCGYLLCCIMAAIKAERLALGYCRKTVSENIGYAYPSSVRVCAILLGSYVMLKILRCRCFVYTKL